MNYRLADAPELMIFLRDEPAATLAVPVSNDGTLHIASLLFWNSTEPFVFYFVTNRQSEKCRLLKTQPSIPAACVVGTKKGTQFTLQMRGTLAEALNADLAEYYQKRGNRFDDIADEKNMCLAFTPSWARFTDYDNGYERHMLLLNENHGN